MKKATAIAPSNIAFIKYWGRKDEELRLPANGSISMNLSGLLTKTTVEFDSSLKEDNIVILNEVKDLEKKEDSSAKPQNDNNSEIASPAKPDRNDNKANEKVARHLDRIRKRAGINEFAKVVSENNFPHGTGLSSSASGFAALTLAGTKACGLDLSEKELSMLARQGSGSACRSIPDGFVEWHDGDSSETSFAESIFSPDYWDIVDIVCILTSDTKDVPTSEGQKGAGSSPFFATRQDHIKDKISKIKTSIKNQNFTEFGELIEHEALEMHAIMLTQHPSLIYWYPETVRMMKVVQKLRKDGLPVYFTINTGQNIHIICENKNVLRVEEILQKIPEVKEILVNHATHGARIMPS